MIAINRLTGHSSGFFSVYTMPPNQAVSLERQRIINRRRNQVPPRRDVPAIIERKSRSLLSSRRAAGGQAPPAVDRAIGRNIPNPVRGGRLDRDLAPIPRRGRLRNRQLAFAAGSWESTPHDVKLSQFRNVDDWQRFVRSTLTELARVTRWGGHIAFECGARSRNGTVRLETHVVAPPPKGLPLKVLGVMINPTGISPKTSKLLGGCEQPAWNKQQPHRPDAKSLTPRNAILTRRINTLRFGLSARGRSSAHVADAEGATGPRNLSGARDRGIGAPLESGGGHSAHRRGKPAIRSGSRANLSGSMTEEALPGAVSSVPDGDSPARIFSRNAPLHAAP